MRKRSTKRTLDGELEAAATIMGVVIIVSAVIAFLDYMDGRDIFIAIFAMGTILNGIISGINWYKHHIIGGIVFAILAVTFLIIFVSTLINY